jgi:hypothetical protein
MRPFTDHPGTRTLGILALAALLHFAHPAPISAQGAGSGGQASAQATARVVSISGVHEAEAMLARLRAEFARGDREASRVRSTRRQEGGIVVEARRGADEGDVTVTVAHLGS